MCVAGRQPRRPVLPCRGDTPEGLILDEGVGSPVPETPNLRFQAGSRQMSALLERRGMPVSRKWVQRLMRNTRLRAIYQQPRTHQPAMDRRSYPDLLRYQTIPGRTRLGRPTTSTGTWPEDLLTWMPWFGKDQGTNERHSRTFPHHLRRVSPRAPFPDLRTPPP